MATHHSHHGALKYRLQELLDQLPRSVRTGTISQALLKEYGITEATFLNHRQIPLESTKQISEGDLAKYAAFFGVEEQELRNYEPAKKRTIYDLLTLQHTISINEIARLTKMSPPVAR